MTITERQWRDIKRIKWNSSESRRIRERVHDDKLVVGWCGKEKRWMLARIVSAVVQMKFGTKTIATSEQAPYIWKRWEDDNGMPLHIRDPRLIQYIQRCDLWRTGADKYMLQFDHADWLEEDKQRAESVEMRDLAKAAFDIVKKESDRLCGYVPARNGPQKYFFGS